MKIRLNDFVRPGVFERAIPMTLVVGCIGLLQWHSIEFWSNQVDSSTGWAWSILLEAVGMWLWYRKGRTSQCLAVVASGLLLVGPLYVVAEPVVDALQTARESRELARQAEAARIQDAQKRSAALKAAKAERERARAQAIPVLEREIQTLENQLQVFLQNSTDRSGWLPAIEKTQAELSQRRKEMTDLYLAAAKIDPMEIVELRELPGKALGTPVRTDLGAIAIIGMQCLALILYQVTGVLAIRRLSQLTESKANAAQVAAVPNPVVERVPEPLPPIETRIPKKKRQLVLYG